MTRLVLIGGGSYRFFDGGRRLDETARLLHRVSEWAKSAWEDLEVIDTLVGVDLTTDAIRTQLPEWLKSAPANGDLLVVWGGHAFNVGGKHRLATFDTPDPRHPETGEVGAQNAIQTTEIADWLHSCPSRRAVFIIDGCWAADGGDALADDLRTATRGQQPEREDGWVAIVASARHEEATEGVFLRAFLEILESGTSPTGLETENSWGPDSQAISVFQLAAAVNTQIEHAGHQAQVNPIGGSPGRFFPLPKPGLALPHDSEDAMRMLVAPQPFQSDGKWTAIRLREVANAWDQLPGCPPGAARRLRRSAVALDAFRYLEGRIGPARTGDVLDYAWRSSLPITTTMRRPETWLGQIESVAHFDASSRKLLEFIVRALKKADQVVDDDLYRWARKYLGVDGQLVRDAILIALEEPPCRLLIDFSQGIEAAADDEALPSEVAAIIYRDGRITGTERIPFGNGSDLAVLVGQLVDWAELATTGLDHVDVVLPTSLLTTSDVYLTRIGSNSQGDGEPLVNHYTLTIHWRGHIGGPDRVTKSLAELASFIASCPDPVLWVQPTEYADYRELRNALEGVRKAVCFTGRPMTLDFYVAALQHAPYLLWVVEDENLREDLAEAVTSHWLDLPRSLVEAHRQASEVFVPPTSTLRTVRAVWDDRHWLETVARALSARHQLRLERGYTQ